MERVSAASVDIFWKELSAVLCSFTIVVLIGFPKVVRGNKIAKNLGFDVLRSSPEILPLFSLPPSKISDGSHFSLSPPSSKIDKPASNPSVNPISSLSTPSPRPTARSSGSLILNDKGLDQELAGGQI